MESSQYDINVLTLEWMPERRCGGHRKKMWYQGIGDVNFVQKGASMMDDGYPALLKRDRLRRPDGSGGDQEKQAQQGFCISFPHPQHLRNTLTRH